MAVTDSERRRDPTEAELTVVPCDMGRPTPSRTVLGWSPCTSLLSRVMSKRISISFRHAHPMGASVRTWVYLRPEVGWVQSDGPGWGVPHPVQT